MTTSKNLWQDTIEHANALILAFEAERDTLPPEHPLVPYYNQIIFDMHHIKDTAATGLLLKENIYV